jgi:hypothetical protein
VKVRVLISQFLALNFGPHHESVHWSADSLLLQGFLLLLLLVTVVIVVMVVTRMDANFQSRGTTR